MNKELITSKPSALAHFLQTTFIGGLLPKFLLLLSIQSSDADSATWLTSPPTRNWNHAANWTPATIPNGPSDTATFATSNKTELFLSADTEVNGIVFSPGASAFTITAPLSFTTPLRISGGGVTNNSGITQNFVTPVDASDIGDIQFSNSATAGSLIVYTNRGGRTIYGGGEIVFLNASSAGDAIFINEGGAVSAAGGGFIGFEDTASAGNGIFTNDGGQVSGADGGLIRFGGVNRIFSTAANGSFTNNGGAVSGANGGRVELIDRAHAGHGTFINNGAVVTGAGGGVTLIEVLAHADNATLIANGGSGGGEGGSIQFSARTRGNTARVKIFGNGNLDISAHFFAGLTIGSLEGNGDVFLGARPLGVGRNNLSTVFSGLIQDGGIAGGVRGSLTKVGKGKLNLNHANTYTGGTTIERGTLTVNNETGSGTGSGPVQIEDGKLAGKGIIAGVVTVGTASGPGAVLSPGYLHGPGSPGALTIQSSLTFNSDATYEVEVNSSSATADEVIANGVTINSGAQFSFEDIRSGALPIGTVFTVIDNAAATPIAGTFSNLPDGSMFTTNGNTYQVNYEGGDGNDLTLTVVP
jgi:autotransporter-associated beta strand protein